MKESKELRGCRLTHFTAKGMLKLSSGQVQNLQRKINKKLCPSWGVDQKTGTNSNSENMMTLASSGTKDIESTTVAALDPPIETLLN